MFTNLKQKQSWFDIFFLVFCSYTELEEIIKFMMQAAQEHLKRVLQRPREHDPRLFFPPVFMGQIDQNKPVS